MEKSHFTVQIQLLSRIAKIDDCWVRSVMRGKVTGVNVILQCSVGYFS
jgi:hypothetical protein